MEVRKIRRNKMEWTTERRYRPLRTGQKEKKQTIQDPYGQISPWHTHYHVEQSWSLK